MKLIALPLACVLLMACSSVLPSPAWAQAPADALRLADEGQTAYVIALREDAIPAEQTAADELAKYLEQVTGATFAIERESDVPADAKQILIGAGERVKSLLPDQDWEALGSDGIVIKTVGDRLILAGGRPRGTLYAVYEFLRESVGYRWWTATESTIPHRPTLDVSAQDTVYVPPFRMREHSGAVPGGAAFATILRENGYYMKQGEELGGHLIQLRCAFADLLPIEEYFEAHPEWYTDALNGDLPCTASSKTPISRKTWQLDLSNPEVVDAFATRAIARIEARPNADTIAIWFNDNPHYCKCDACMAVIDAQGSPAGIMVQFTNRVAERIHEKHPGFPVQMQAYWWTIKAPRTLRPAEGVVVDLAPMGADFGRPFNSEWNTKSRDQLLAWAKVASQLHVWYYVTDFRWLLFPFPNWDALGQDLRFWADHHVVGVYEQGNARPGVGAFVELRTWLLGRLLWNPYADQAELTREFLDGYYGDAGPYLGRYLELVQQAFVDSGNRLGPYNADLTFMTLDVVNEGIRLFDQAAAAVKDNPTLTARVLGSRLTLDVVVLAKFKYFHREAQAQGKTFLGPTDLAPALAAFEAKAKRFGIEKYSAGTEMLIARLKRRDTASLPDFAQGYAPDDVVDFPADDIHLYAKGTLTAVVPDPSASTGKAATAIGSTREQAIQVRIGPSLPARQWRVYVLARVDAAPDADPKGLGFTGGVKDLNSGKMIFKYPFPMSELMGPQYHVFDMGVHELDGGKEIRFTPAGRDDIKQVRIDRVIFIRDGAKRGPQQEQ